MEKLRYTVKEAAPLLGKSAGALQHDIAARKIQVVHDGRRVYIIADELKRYAVTSTPRGLGQQPARV